MNRAKINKLYEQAYVVYEIPYESSVVDPTIVSVHTQKVWDRYLFAESIVRECTRSLWTEECNVSDLALEEFKKNSKKIKQHFGVKE